MRTPEHIIGEITGLPDDQSDFTVTREELIACQVKVRTDKAMRGTDQPYHDEQKIPFYLECMGHRLVEINADHD